MEIILSSDLFPNIFFSLYRTYLKMRTQSKLQLVDLLAGWEIMIQMEETVPCFTPLTLSL